MPRHIWNHLDLQKTEQRFSANSCSVSLFWYLFSIKHLDLHFFHNIVIWFQVCCSCKAKNAFPFTSNQCSVIEKFIAVNATVIIMFAQRRLLIPQDYLFIYLFYHFITFFSIFVFPSFQFSSLNCIGIWCSSHRNST